VNVSDISAAKAKRDAKTCAQRRSHSVAVYAHGGLEQGDRLLPMAEVERMTSARKSWIYDRINRGQFPRPIRLCAGRRVAWSEKAIQAWIQAQAAAAQATAQQGTDGVGV